MSTPTRPAGAPAPGTFGTAETFGTFLRWGTMGTKRRSFLPLETFLSFFSFLPFLPLETFQSFLTFLPLETFLSFFSFLPLESFQSFLTFLSFHTGKTFPSFLSFQALSVTALKRRATSPARVGGSPLRHSPLARPVPPLPHAGEANVTCRLQPPTFTGEVARRAGEGSCLRATGRRS